MENLNVRIIREREPWGPGRNWSAVIVQGAEVVASSEFVQSRAAAVKEAIKLAQGLGLALAS